MRRPRCSKSSPVLTTVRSSAGASSAAWRPAASFAPPTPPASARITGRGPVAADARDRGRGPRAPPRSGPRRRAADQGGRPPLRPLSHDDGGGGRDRVCDPDLGDVEGAAEEIGLAAAVEAGGEAAHPDREADRALAPRPTDAVGHDDPDPRPAAATRSGDERGAEAVGGGVRVLGEEQQVVVLLVVLDVRHVGACVREDDPVAGLDDEHPGGRAHHLDGFPENGLDRPRVLLRSGRELDCPRRRGDVRDPHDPPFRLGHDLLRDHQHVPVPERLAGARDRVRDKLARIVAGADRGEPGKRPDPQLRRGHAAGRTPAAERAVPAARRPSRPARPSRTAKRAVRARGSRRTPRRRRPVIPRRDR